MFRRNGSLQVVYAGLVAFALYSCMYAFRKPFTAATYEQVTGFGQSYKVWLVLAQLAGYTFSKFIGIRVISEMSPARRRLWLVGLIITAWLFLLGFAVSSPSAGLAFMALNGLPLGLVWGVVFSYLEGRRTTEIMGAMLSVSFIFSSGFVKSVGAWIMKDWHISEQWMPFATGSLFFLPFVLFAWLMERLPAPSAEDQALRTRRVPMNKKERRLFWIAFLPGLTALVLVYIILSVGRDFRDNFAAELFRENGYAGVPSVFTLTEIPASLAILAIMGALFLIKNNFKAFLINHILVAAGLLLALLSSLLFWFEFMPPLLWITLTGLGLYMGYVPFNCLLFERLIAVARQPANAGFLIYVADAFGYLGAFGVYLLRIKNPNSERWTPFFMMLLISGCIVALVALTFSIRYFARKIQQI